MKPSDIIETNEVREYLRKPFNLCGMSVATNGHVALFFPEDKQYEPCREKVEKYLSVVLDTAKKAEYVELPAIKQPKKIECPTCRGSKKASTKDCEECEGDGVVDLENNYSTYFDVECKSCDGEGQFVVLDTDKPCSHCNGSGVVYEDYAAVEILGIKIAARYADLLTTEKEIEVFANHKDTQLYFRYPDHYGVIMGMRF